MEKLCDIYEVDVPDYQTPLGNMQFNFNTKLGIKYATALARTELIAINKRIITKIKAEKIKLEEQQSSISNQAFAQKGQEPNQAGGSSYTSSSWKGTAAGMIFVGSLKSGTRNRVGGRSSGGGGGNKGRSARPSGVGDGDSKLTTEVLRKVQK